MIVHPADVIYTAVKPPSVSVPGTPVDITDKTMGWRRDKVLRAMQNLGMDALLIYGDREHGANFGYLAGFEPRFEEALIVLHSTGKAYMLLGNESLHMARYSKLLVEAIHVPFFSLPNQPMEGETSLLDAMKKAGITEGSHICIAGWKMFTSTIENNEILFDVPHFIVDAAIRSVGNRGKVRNACHLFIDPVDGVRIIANANEIAYYEFGAALASSRILSLLNDIEVGKTEMELADRLSAYGQPLTVQAICATGERFSNAIVSPRNKALVLGDKFSVTMGLRGGLTSRSGYIAKTIEDLPNEVSDYLEVVVKPYYAVAATWYSSLAIGVSGGEIYSAVNKVTPKEKYGWVLNPGHYVASEEWMSSPFYPGSSVKIQSGMMLQMDIIFKIPGYGGSNAEDGIAIADKTLRDELKKCYPETWDRIERRRHYLTQVLGIPISEEIIPLSNTEAYLRPLLLEKSKALKLCGIEGR
jgi:Xaa-Pro aminopeptidase